MKLGRLFFVVLAIAVIAEIWVGGANGVAFYGTSKQKAEIKAAANELAAAYDRHSFSSYDAGSGEKIPANPDFEPEPWLEARDCAVISLREEIQAAGYKIFLVRQPGWRCEGGHSSTPGPTVLIFW